MEMTSVDVTVAPPHERWVHWPVFWSAIWVGALAALATALVLGLVGIAIGAHLVGPGHEIVSWGKFGIGALAYSVFSAFLSFVVGGWVAARVAGIRRSEPAMLHGAIAWLVVLPLLLVLIALGAGNLYGGWYGGLAGAPAWATPPEIPLGENATQAEREAWQAKQDRAARIARNTATGTVTALLLGLMGAVIGGWMASGEPMTFSHYRTRGTTSAGRFNEPRTIGEEVPIRR